MKSRVAFALVLSLLSTPVAAQQEFEAIIKRVQAVSATSTKSDCDAQLAKARTANAFDLFYASGVCSVAKQKPESSFLLLAAQIRATPDMDLMMPVAQADAKKVIGLYGFIYYYAGGLGDEEVLRDRRQRERLYLLLDQWKPPYDASYNPGWATRQRPSEVEYRAALEESAAERRRQLEEMVRLYSDDIYYSLHRQERDLYAKQGGPVVADSPAARQLSDLARKMNDRAVALGLGNAPKQIPIDEAGAHLPSTDEPPDAPGGDERIIDGSNDPVVKRCTKGAEFMELLSNARIARVLVTTTKKWGTVWRADLEGGNFGSERRVCTANYDGSRPLDMGPKDRLAPLPAGPK